MRLQKNSLMSSNWKTGLEKPCTSCIQGIHVLIVMICFRRTTHALNSAFHIKKQNEEEGDKSQGWWKRSKEDEAECSLVCIWCQQKKIWNLYLRDQLLVSTRKVSKSENIKTAHVCYKQFISNFGFIKVTLRVILTSKVCVINYYLNPFQVSFLSVTPVNIRSFFHVLEGMKTKLIFHSVNSSVDILYILILWLTLISMHYLLFGYYILNKVK